MEGIELISFQIISAVGSARSYYIEAMRQAREGNFVQAEELLEKGKKDFAEGHSAHTELLQREASGDPVGFRLILMHAEDQLMSAEQFGILAVEFIETYKMIREKG